MALAHSPAAAARLWRPRPVPGRIRKGRCAKCGCRNSTSAETLSSLPPSHRNDCVTQIDLSQANGRVVALRQYREWRRTLRSSGKYRPLILTQSPHRRRVSDAPKLTFEFYQVARSARQFQTPRIWIDRMFFRNGSVKNDQSFCHNKQILYHSRNLGKQFLANSHRHEKLH